jgi:hypothetical protein
LGPTRGKVLGRRQPRLTRVLRKQVRIFVAPKNCRQNCCQKLLPKIATSWN